MSVLTADDHLLTGGDAVQDLYLEPACGDLEDKEVTHLQVMESSKGRPSFVQDDLALVAIGMDNPLAFHAALNYHMLGVVAPLQVCPELFWDDKHRQVIVVQLDIEALRMRHPGVVADLCRAAFSFDTTNN